MARPKNNNNPFALMDTSPDSWKGLIGKAQDGFLIFDSPENGTRAGFINLINAYLKRGLNTIEKIFPVYAPAGHGDNDPEVYIKRVVQLTGIPRNEKITSSSDIYKLGKAIVTHEEGNFWLTQQQFNAGFESAVGGSSFLKDSPGLFGAGTGVVALLILYLIVTYA